MNGQGLVTSMLRRIVCAVFGHDWIWRREPIDDGGIYVAPRLLEQPYKCKRCGHFDDEPGIARAARCKAWLRRWSPVGVAVNGKRTRIRLGLPYIRQARHLALSVSVEVDYAWERFAGGTGITVSATIWRLRLGGRIGGLWQDEDGDGRSLFGIWAQFTTYGLRYMPCWFGHKPCAAERVAGYVYCARCEESLDLADAHPRKAVAL